MSDQAFTRVTAAQFHASPGVEDWRVLFWGAHAFFRTSSFGEGARFVVAIADAAAAVDKEPDVDLRPQGVTIRLFTRKDGALGENDAVLAARISEIARAQGLAADPSSVQTIGIAVAQGKDSDGDDIDTRPFWTAALGYVDLFDEDAIDPLRRGPHLWFHELTPPTPGRGRTHIDVSVPADVIRQRVDAAVAAGGRIVDDTNAPGHWTLASPDNHGVDIAAWPDFEDHEEDG